MADLGAWTEASSKGLELWARSYPATQPAWPSFCSLRQLNSHRYSDFRPISVQAPSWSLNLSQSHFQRTRHRSQVSCNASSEASTSQADQFPGSQLPKHADDPSLVIPLPEDFEHQWAVLPRPLPQTGKWDSDEIKEEYLEDLPSTMRRTVEERFGIHIEKNLSQERLAKLKVQQWGRYTLQKGSLYPWKYNACPEVAYITKGRVKLTPDWCKESAYAEAGDLVVFPKWLSLTWEAEEDMEKRFKFFYKHAPPSQEWYQLSHMSKEERLKHFPEEEEEESAAARAKAEEDEADDEEEEADEEDDAKEEEEDDDVDDEDDEVVEEDELVEESGALAAEGQPPRAEK